MICDDLQKKLKEHQDKINKLNSAEINMRLDMGEGKSPDDVRDLLIHRDGFTPDLADSMVSSATGWHPDMIKQVGELNELGDKAIEFQKQAQSPKESSVNADFLKEKATTFRDRVSEVMSRSFNALPRNMNDKLRNALKSFATFRDSIVLAPGVIAGRNAKYFIRNEVDNLYKNSGSTISRKDFGVALETAAHAGRKENPLSYLKDYKDKIMQNVSAHPVLKNLYHKIELAENVYNLPGVKDYLETTYKRLDVANEKAFKGEGKQDYYHSHVIVEPHLDVWDSIFLGDRKSKSSIMERKKFKDGIESEFFSGMNDGKVKYKIASDDFVETNGMYWSAVGNKVRKELFAKQLKDNAELANAHPDKMMIEVNSDYAEPAFSRRPINSEGWEPPKTESGELYREMSNLGGQFSGIYAHPEVYRWQERVFRQVKPDGVMAGALKGIRLWKTLVLSGASIPHAGSLTRKYFYLAAKAGLKDGVNNIWDIKSTVTNGLAALDVNSPHHATTLKLFENGLSLETYDMSRNAAFDRKYDIKTGEQTFLSNLSEGIKNFTDFSHKMLFEKYRTGLKLGMALKMADSDYFKDLTAKHGGDSNAAFGELATTINDHFGGQNLELIGRSRLVQSFMQATLLSPEWTEAKFRRVFGTVFNPSPELRRSYQLSLAAQMGSFLILKVALQEIYNATHPNDQRTLDQMKDDILNRRFASIYIGKTGGKNSKELFWNIGISENQDIGMMLPLFKGTWDSFAQMDPTQLPKAIGSEIAHKLSPPAQGILGVLQQKSARDKAIDKRAWEGKSFPEKVAATAKPFLPIGVQQTGEALSGEYGEPAAGMAALSAPLAIAGAPLQTYAQKKPEKKKLGLKK